MDHSSTRVPLSQLWFTLQPRSCWSNSLYSQPAKGKTKLCYHHSQSDDYRHRKLDLAGSLCSSPNQRVRSPVSKRTIWICFFKCNSGSIFSMKMGTCPKGWRRTSVNWLPERGDLQESSTGAGMLLSPCSSWRWWNCQTAASLLRPTQVKAKAEARKCSSGWDCIEGF